MDEHNQLSAAEINIVQELANVWNQFLTLADLTSDDIHEFRHAIHAAQRLILARTGRRQIAGDEITWPMR